MCDVDFGFGRPTAFRQLSDVVLENMMVICPSTPRLEGQRPDQGFGDHGALLKDTPSMT